MTIAAYRTWTINKDARSFKSNEIIELPPTFNGTLAMDFSQILNPNTIISSADSVADADSGSITIGSPSVSGDKRSVLFNVSNLIDGTTYRIVVTITTSDSQTIPGTGILKGEDNP